MSQALIRLLGGCTCLFALSLFGFMAPTPPKPQVLQAQPGRINITGYYVANGTSISGKTYQNRVVFIVKANESYLLRWVPINEPVSTGIGIYDGKHLVIASSTMENAGAMTCATYRVELDDGKPRLVGKWTSLGSLGKQGTETLVFLKPLD